ncbi:MAG: pteridine-dependent deoxygenase [Gammaproteobacteria bacterium]|nr:pteridine-dependent deoxygenase [Gammaproteobacteria bacterium]
MNSAPRPSLFAALHPARLAVDYVEAVSPEGLLDADDVLAVLAFGNAAPHSDDPRYLRVPLQPWNRTASQSAPYEVWRANGPVARGRDGDIAWASDGQLLFGAIQVEESTAPGNAGIAEAAEHAYANLTALVRDSGHRHLLRVWNYLDAITLGEGDTERYRQFCIGRARGLGDFDASSLPAASAIGRCDEARIIQVYWLAAREPGTPVENPRQIAAYRYPRQYGPQPPSFARAMLPPAASAMPLLLSGTASVVGHQSRHGDCLESQLAETFANFDSLIAAARQQRPDLPPTFGAGSRLKVYVRDAADLPRVATALDARLGPDVPRLLLHAAICRRELRVEIDGVHG